MASVDFIAATICLTLVVTAFVVMMTVDLCGSSKRETNVVSSRKYVFEMTQSVSWTILTFMPLVVFGFWFYPAVTRYNLYMSTIYSTDLVYDQRWVYVLAVGWVFVASILFDWFYTSAFVYYLQLPSHGVWLDGGMHFGSVVKEIDRSKATAKVEYRGVNRWGCLKCVCTGTGLVERILYYFNFACFVFYVVYRLVFFGINPNAYYGDPPGILVAGLGFRKAYGWDITSSLVVAAGCMILITAFCNSFGRLEFKRDRVNGGTIMTETEKSGQTIRNRLEAQLKVCAIPVMSGKGIDKTKLSSRPNDLSTYSTIPSKQIPENHELSVILTESISAIRNTPDTHVKTDDFAVRKVNNNIYAVAKQDAAHLDHMMFGDRKSTSFQAKAEKRVPGQSSKIETFAFVENTAFDVSEHPVMFVDYDNAIPNYMIMTHRVYGFGTGVGLWMNFKQSVIIPFIFFELVMNIYFMMDTRLGIMLWIIQVWPPLFAALSGRFGQFWQLFKQQWLVSWIIMLSMALFISQDEMFITSNSNWNVTEPFPGIIFDGDTSLDNSTSYMTAGVLTFASSAIGMLFSLVLCAGYCCCKLDLDPRMNDFQRRDQKIADAARKKAEAAEKKAAEEKRLTKTQMASRGY